MGDKYKIFICGEQTHSASTSVGGIVSLYEVNNERPKMTIDKLFYLFKASFDLTRSDNSVLHFRTQSFWKSEYECWVGADFYVIYGHRGRKYSIFKNEQQIAWWDKNAVSWFGGEKYKIIADQNADIELLISFCLVVDNITENSRGNNPIRIDIGNIFSQGRKFDQGWQPK